MRSQWIDELFVLLAAPARADTIMRDDWVDDVLTFWFEELEPKDWFRKSDETDTLIHDRFLKLYANVARMQPADHMASARQALAAVIVLDQFPRNMFRGSPHSFGTDKIARRVAALAVDATLDQQLQTKDQKVFLYLPYEHSEDIADQHLAVELIAAVGDPEYTRYAEAHRDVIQQFGRFPHRNAALGRASTDEEVAFLAKPGSGF